MFRIRTTSSILGFLWIFCQMTAYQTHTWSSTSNVVHRDTYPMFAKKFGCIEQLQDVVNHFSLNVSLNSFARLTVQTSSVYLALSSDDNLWHYIKTKSTGGPFTDIIDIHFMLVYEERAPNGNCSFQFYTEPIESQPEISADQTSTVWIDPSYDIKSTALSSISQYEASSEAFDKNSQFQTVSTIYSPEATDKADERLPTDSSEDVCLCPCACVNPISQENADQMLADMIEEMQIHKFMTSQTKRKLSSATDSRISSTGIGIVGVLVLTAVFGVIVIGDAKLFMRNVRSAARRVYGNLKYSIRKNITRKA